MELISPLLLTLSIIIFISYVTATYVVIPDQSWRSTGLTHIALLILTVWSLLATKMTDPGCVSNLYESEKQEVDAEKAEGGDPLSGF